MNNGTKFKSGNIFFDIPHQINDEVFDTILNADTVKIKRIVSKGQKSPADYWYDQEKNEWVMVLKGTSKLKFKDGRKIVEMKPGDYVCIPAHCKHSVEWTDPDVETIWLAIFY